MQRGPRQTHAGRRNHGGCRQGTRAPAAPAELQVLCAPQAPHHTLPIYSPPMAVLRSRSGERGEREGAEEWENATGPILNTIPALQDLTLAGRGSMAEPEAQGRLSITAPRNQPQVGLGMCNPTTGGCSANTSHRTQGGGGSLGCARLQHMASGNTSHCQHLPTNSRHSAGRGWARWAGMRSSLGKKQERRGKGE